MNNNFSKIADDVVLGENVSIYNYVNLYGCSIGNNTKIGSFVEIQKNVTVGTSCKISSHTFICEGVSIGNSCFIGHGVMFINDRYPHSVNNKGELKTDKDWKIEQIFIKDKVSIGSNSTILCGITINTGAVIGAGSVVTKDVPPFCVVAGNPAKIIRRLYKGDAK